MCKKLFAGILITALSASACAVQWHADDAEVSFLTTKVTKNLTTITEINRFKKATATLSATGKLNAVIDLNSIDSGVEIRDNRLQTYIFAMAKEQKLSYSSYARQIIHSVSAQSSLFC